MPPRRGSLAIASLPRSRNLALGLLFGFGAPLGFFALRRLVRRGVPGRASALEELRQNRWAYAYMSAATPLVFGLFGVALGRFEERVAQLAAQLNRLRDEFAAVVAHDLRTPLSSISFHLQLLLRQRRGETVEAPVATLERMQQATARLTEMIGDLLDASRIEASRLALATQAMDLGAAVSALVERIRPTLGEHAVSLEIERDVPPVRADPLRLDQIATNLLDNAAKYSPAGAPVAVAIRPSEGGALLSVADHGFGIAPEEVPRLFDRFYQTRRARRQKSGLGLGLYITKGLVEAHGGRIWLESAVDQGSTFYVWLPAAGT